MEIWKDIPGYEGKYRVSDRGRVMRLNKTKPPRILSPSPRREGGYLSVSLCINNQKTTHFVHRLVLGAFVGPCPDDLEVCHADGDKHNNRLSNLRYDTRHENRRDRFDHGTLKLTEDDVKSIREVDGTNAEVGDMFGVSGALVSLIRNRRIYVWVN